MSSIAAYGPGLDHRESDPAAPDDAPVPYVQHKAAAERLLFRMHAESGFPVSTFRPPFVHGPMTFMRLNDIRGAIGSRRFTID